MNYSEVKQLGAVLTEVSIPFKFFTFRYQLSGVEDPEPGLRAAYAWQAQFVDGLIGAPIVLAVKPPDDDPSQEARAPEEPERVPDSDGTADIRVLPGPLQIAHVVSEGGTHYCKVFGGKFSRFGIPAWPEVVEAAGLEDWETWPVATGKKDGYQENRRGLPPTMTAFILFDGEKARKITELR